MILQVPNPPTSEPGKSSQHPVGLQQPEWQESSSMLRQPFFSVGPEKIPSGLGRGISVKGKQGKPMQSKAPVTNDKNGVIRAHNFTLTGVKLNMWNPYEFSAVLEGSHNSHIPRHPSNPPVIPGEWLLVWMELWKKCLSQLTCSSPSTSTMLSSGWRLTKQRGGCHPTCCFSKNIYHDTSI